MSSPHRSPVDLPDHRIPDENERILEERRTARRALPAIYVVSPITIRRTNTALGWLPSTRASTSQMRNPARMEARYFDRLYFDRFVT